MEKSELRFQNSEETEQKIKDDFNRLQRVAEILRSLDLKVIDRSITIDKLQDPTAEIGFPIVMDGLQGIRASYSKRSGLKIWFTNSFGDSNNPKRQEVEKQLKEAGLL